MISKKKQIEDVIDLFNKDDRVKQIFVLGKPHFKLLDYDKGHQMIEAIGTKKLCKLITAKSSKVGFDDNSSHKLE